MRMYSNLLQTTTLEPKFILPDGGKTCYRDKKLEKNFLMQYRRKRKRKKVNVKKKSYMCLCEKILFEPSRSIDHLEEGCR